MNESTLRPAARPEREYGIDLLKIVAMMFICILHVCNNGGIMSRISQDKEFDTYLLITFLKAATYGAVNIYAMISGYLGWQKSFKLSRPVMIWLQLVFYTILGTALISIFTPSLLTENAWFHSLMPVMNAEYWYMTAYFGMVVLMPLLNVVIQKTSVRTLSLVLLGVLVVFCVLPTVFDVSVFGLSGGYSMVWLCIMYIAGGYINRIKKPHPLLCLGIYLLMTVLTCIIRVKGASVILKYTSPTVFIGSVALLLAFSQIKLRTKFFKAVISFTAQLTLGIYLAHVHTFFWDNYLKDCLKQFAHNNVFIVFLVTLAASAAIFVICGAVDAARRGLFRLIHIRPLLQRIDKALSGVFEKKEDDKNGAPEKTE